MNTRSTPRRAAAVSPDALRRLIDNALPKRKLAVERDALIRALVHQIQKWKKLERKWVRQLTKHHTKLRELVSIADRLKKAVGAANDKLLGLGVRLTDVMDPGTGEATRRHSAEIDLYLVALRAADGLRRWERLWRPGRGRRKSIAALLTEDLQKVCREWGGLSREGFEDFCAGLNQNKMLIPVLVPSTLKQRKHRAKKKSRETI